MFNLDDEPVISITRVIDSTESGTWLDLFTVPAGKTLYVYHFDSSLVVEDPESVVPAMLSIREKPCGEEETPPTVGDKFNEHLNQFHAATDKTGEIESPFWQFNGGSCVGVMATVPNGASPVVCVNIVGVLR